MPPPQTHVLIEHENSQVREVQAAALEAAGFKVTTCPGPASLPGRTCPLVARGYCRAAFTADVILDELPLGQLRVYVAEHAALPDRAILLGLSNAERARFPILDSLTTWVPRNLTGSELVDAVRRAAAERPSDS